MTLPDERYASITHARELLVALCDPKKTPRVSRHIRHEAAMILRHYPDNHHMQTVSHYAPDIFQERIEPVQRLIMKYEEKDNEA